MTYTSSMTDRPDGIKALDSIQAELNATFGIEVGQRNDEYLSFKVNGSDWFSIRITAERIHFGSLEWVDGSFNWNGRWKIELMMGVMADRSKTWRPTDEKISEAIPKIIKVVQDWIDQDQRGKFDGPKLIS